METIQEIIEQKTMAANIGYEFSLSPVLGYSTEKETK